MYTKLIDFFTVICEQLTKHNPNSYNTIKFTLFAASDLFQIGAYCFGGEYLRAKVK